MNDYFKKAGDLNVSGIDSDKLTTGNKMNDYFKSPGDIASNDITNIEEYLLTIVSGKKYDNECELGTLVGGGNTIVDFNKLQEMVKLGFNIVNAKYINDNMIMVEFQEYKKNDSRGMGR